MDYIPEPPCNSQMFLQRDNRFANDDYLLWPQRYTDVMCHYACILRNDPGIAPAIITLVLHQPYEPNYFMLNSMGTLHGLGHLCADILNRLQHCFKYLSERQKKYEDNLDLSKTPLGHQILSFTQQLIKFLVNLPMTTKQLHFIFCQAQCLFLEHMGFICYLTTIKPCMVAGGDTIAEKMDAIGTFHHSITEAQAYFEAGVPVWLILPANRAGTG